MKDFKINLKPDTIGFWRPIEVEIGFIEDDIKITKLKTNETFKRK